jgi:hypothetical protein
MTSAQNRGGDANPRRERLPGTFRPLHTFPCRYHSCACRIGLRKLTQWRPDAGQIEEKQMAAGAALAAKRGERPKASLKGASREMVDSMSERQLREFASTKRRGLPRKKSG